MERIIRLFWGDEVPVTARNAVQGLVVSLRRSLHVLPDVRLVTRGPGYLLQVDPDQVDVFRFRREVERARTLPDPEAADVLRGALALWRGAPLADIPYESVRLRVGGVLEQELLAAQEMRAEIELRLGKHRDLVPVLARLADEHPVRESLHGLLMLAHYRSGHTADALETFRQLNRRLVTEYGITTGPAMRELHETMLRS
ncbi:DNA-binding SARP family transcriptional activator [Saccharothrix tamanrassetensis]|uniref:DNA-binding SARP family transcriptional activator n=1 Tax=Saccharothrix tamanrassetensis TaxID=1051531 RepID=A0A841CD85_9PSEU|nr:DNA-binding SARP family transcriptional activator [Saccharothrix tamanrassetensis]